MKIQQKKSARIYWMKADNVRGVDLIECELKNGRVVLCGDNGSGKSSMIFGFMMSALGRNRFPEKFDSFVGPYGDKGVFEFRIKADRGASDLGEKLFIHYEETRGGTVKLTITDEETGTVHTTTPRKKLDKFLGQFLDPIELMKEIESHNGDKKLAEKLCALVGLDLQPFVKTETELFADLQDENKENARLKGKFASLVKPQNDWPTEYTDPQKISEELQKLNSLKARNEDRARNIAKAYQELDQGISIRKQIEQSVEKAKSDWDFAEKNANTIAETLIQKQTEFIDVKEECKPDEWNGTADIEEKIKKLMAELEEKKKFDDAEAVKKQRIDRFQQNLELFEEKVKASKKDADEKAEALKQKQAEKERQEDIVGQLANKADRSHDENPLEKWTGETLEGTFPLVYLTAKMASVTARNKLYNARIDFDETKTALESSDAEIKRINSERDDNRIKKAKAVASVKEKFPHPGITVDENTVWVDLDDGRGKRTINDLSVGEKITICCHLIIAFNTGIIDLLVIRDGSSLDSKNRSIIYSIADEYGYDVILETIETSEVGALYIEDGKIKGINKSPDEYHSENNNQITEPEPDLELEELDEPIMETESDDQRPLW